MSKRLEVGCRVMFVFGNNKATRAMVGCTGTLVEGPYPSGPPLSEYTGKHWTVASESARIAAARALGILDQSPGAPLKNIPAFALVRIDDPDVTVAGTKEQDLLRPKSHNVRGNRLAPEQE